SGEDVIIRTIRSYCDHISYVMQTFVIPMVKGNILNKTERILKPRNYSPMTHKAYLFYIEEQINFSK
ncbi:TPA: hypothetical protein DEP86_03215, partial [Candidatus Uhrbacteria bacterium]|nr:hypothetical protein [Candidatus Uhrbacteria bacterium]